MPGFGWTLHLPTHGRRVQVYSSNAASCRAKWQLLRRSMCAGGCVGGWVSSKMKMLGPVISCPRKVFTEHTSFLKELQQAQFDCHFVLAQPVWQPIDPNQLRAAASAHPLTTTRPLVAPPSHTQCSLHCGASAGVRQLPVSRSNQVLNTTHAHLALGIPLFPSLSLQL